MNDKLNVNKPVPPFMSKDINMGNCRNLPAYSSGPRGNERKLLEEIKKEGYEGVQDGDPKICAELGLRYSASFRINKVGEGSESFRKWKDEGYECATLHVGWGMESEEEINRLVDYVLSISNKTKLPLYIETHRSTITQDIWRTVKMIEKFPEVRINGDFSHWYTGQEMVYGDIEEKWDFIQPVFDRVNFIHARIGNPGCIQVGIKNDQGEKYVDHFKEMWVRSFVGFLKRAGEGDYISFNPELLGAEIYYARVFPNAQNELVEESDRWQQARLYTEIAAECWDEALLRVKK
jgi:hypothetical protein